MSKNTVKDALTSDAGSQRGKRDRRAVENADYASFTRRILRSYASRVAAGDIEALRLLVELPSEVDATLRTAVTGLRAFGYSWSDIAARLGTSKQAAQSRFGTTTAAVPVGDPDQVGWSR